MLVSVNPVTVPPFTFSLIFFVAAVVPILFLFTRTIPFPPLSTAASTPVLEYCSFIRAATSATVLAVPVILVPFTVMSKVFEFPPASNLPSF